MHLQIHSTKVCIDRAASVHTFYMRMLGDTYCAEHHQSIRNRSQLWRLLASREAFLLRVELVSDKSRQRIIDKIRSLGFTVEATNKPDYNLYAWR